MGYAKFLLTDKRLSLPPGTTRRVYDSLVEQGFIQQKTYTSRVSESQLKEFRDLFSKKNTNISGKMGDKLSVHDMLDTFIMMYPYTWEEIISATKAYIFDRMNSDRPDLIMRADNFIKKIRADETSFSRLAEYCENPKSERNLPDINDSII